MTPPTRAKWWHDVVSSDSVRLNDFTYLLWGDRVKVLEEDPETDRVRVHARGTTGWIDRSDLGGEPLLELYFIDVGQGDGVLVVTPEGHHLMIDGGYQRTRQQTGRRRDDRLARGRRSLRRAPGPGRPGHAVVGRGAGHRRGHGRAIPSPGALPPADGRSGRPLRLSPPTREWTATAAESLRHSRSVIQMAQRVFGGGS